MCAVPWYFNTALWIVRIGTAPLSPMAPIPTPLTSLGSHADYDNTIGDSCSPRLLYLNWPAALNNGGQERAFA